MKQKVLSLGGAMLAAGALVVTATAQLRNQEGGQVSTELWQVASKDDESGERPYKTGNIAQRVLQCALNGRANLLIDIATEQGRPELSTKIVLANNYVMLTLMRPDQQQHEIHDVWQVEKFVPGNKDWAEVCKAPSLINELGKLDSATSKKIEAAWDNVWKELMSPLLAVEHRLLAEPGFSKLSSQEQQNRVFQEMQKLPKKTKVQTGLEAVNRWTGLLGYTRSLLNSQQQAEFDGFVTRHEQAMNTASASISPPPGVFGQH